MGARVEGLAARLRAEEGCDRVVGVGHSTGALALLAVRPEIKSTAEVNYGDIHSARIRLRPAK